MSSKQITCHEADRLDVLLAVEAVGHDDEEEGTTWALPTEATDGWLEAKGLLLIAVAEGGNLAFPTERSQGAVNAHDESCPDWQAHLEFRDKMSAYVVWQCEQDRTGAP